MPVVSFETAVLTLASNANFISGSAFEFARTPELINIGITASATGAFVTIQNGSDIIAEEFTPYVATVFPVIPDQMYFSDYASIGDRLVIKGRNPTGGTITFRGIVQISQVG
jgi:hypothetical protein